jgi:hypothetical protein
VKSHGLVVEGEVDDGVPLDRCPRLPADSEWVKLPLGRENRLSVRINF